MFNLLILGVYNIVLLLFFQYNGIDFTRATAEQAYRHITEPCSSVRIRVRYHPSRKFLFYYTINQLLFCNHIQRIND